jgi:hypothetical protein
MEGAVDPGADHFRSLVLFRPRGVPPLSNPKPAFENSMENASALQIDCFDPIVPLTSNFIFLISDLTHSQVCVLQEICLDVYNTIIDFDP